LCGVVLGDLVLQQHAIGVRSRRFGRAEKGNGSLLTPLSQRRERSQYPAKISNESWPFLSRNRDIFRS
jgi:hypothetical protein